MNGAHFPSTCCHNCGQTVPLAQVYVAVKHTGPHQTAQHYFCDKGCADAWYVKSLRRFAS